MMVVKMVARGCICVSMLVILRRVKGFWGWFGIARTARVRGQGLGPSREGALQTWPALQGEGSAVDAGGRGRCLFQVTKA